MKTEKRERYEKLKAALDGILSRTLVTERLILRPFISDDAADVFKYLAVPAVNCFACMKLDSLDSAKTEMEKRAKDEFYLAIILKETGKVVGELFGHPEGTKPEDETMDTFSPCWMLNLKYGGKGYAHEAAHAYYDWLFFQKGIRRIYTYTEDERLGMRREGLFMEFVSFINNPDGTPLYENTVQYAILKKEWEERKCSS